MAPTIGASDAHKSSSAVVRACLPTTCRLTGSPDVAQGSATAGCRDGLGATAPNLNQGAESTVSFLLSLMAMLELAGEGLEYADTVTADA